MSTLVADPQPAVSSGLVPQPTRTRVLSIDIFRGFTMAVMIFVNDLSDVHGLPRWTYHMPRDVDAMTYVDMVYPFFLFAVGLSLPLATRQRLRRDPSLFRLWLHIAARCLALVTLGLILANAEKISLSLSHMHGSAWALAALTGAILFWAVYPPAVSPRLARILKTSGAVLLLTMLALFRRRLPDGHAAWLDFRYPEILGLIGLTYFAVCLLYVPTRRFIWAPVAWFAALLLFNVACLAQWIRMPHIPLYFFPFDNGSMPAIIMAGVVVAGIFLSDNLRQTPRRQLALGLGIALLTLALGFALKPLGISKIRATPTWALWSISAATAIFTLLYWICDLRNKTTWAAPLRAPGANTLLTYLLPDLTYYLLALTHLSFTLGRWNTGRAGVIRSLCFTAAMLALSSLVTRAKLRLQL